jgi:hypothetical protein
MRVDADLTFSYRAPASQESDSPTLSGTITGAGNHLEVRCDSITEVSARRIAPLLRGAGAKLAAQGLTVSVFGPQGLLVTIGAVKGSLFQRVLTRSRHIRVEHSAQFLRLTRPRAAPPAGLTMAQLLPPPAVVPIAPTFRRQPRRVTTTHDPLGGGRPRLLFPVGPRSMPGQLPRAFYLKASGTTIGSGPDSDLRLDGLEETQAEIRRNEDDEYVLISRSQSLPSRVNGQPVSEALLRTGTRIQFGDWTMSYFRQEFADHGRPYGGRIGGELGHQRPQSTPTYEPPEYP